MTIYALSSGPGISGVAVIRISGPDTKEVLLKLISGELPKPRVATLKKINKINTNEIIDEGIILWFPGPQSYTGEDMAEFHVHGSRSVIEALHSSISSINGCRLAEPGEFTKLAFQNNKIYNSWRKRLLKILSYTEAKIDFPEDDLPKDIDQKIKVEANLIKTEIIKKLDDQKIGERIREGFKIAIVGPANAGKSTLLNYLSKRKVAIVSEIAGTTRDVIETHLNIDGFPVIVSDTAGIRESKDEIEREGIKLALKKAEDADLNIVLIEPKNADFAGFLRDLINDRSILVVNKSDLGIDNMILDFKKYNPIYLSLKKEKNIDELILKIKERLNKLFIRSEDILITRERHRQHLEQCVSYLENFENKKDSEDFDKASEDLRLATRQLGMIVGKVDVEEILGSIFSDFCIGK